MNVNCKVDLSNTEKTFLSNIAFNVTFASQGVVVVVNVSKGMNDALFVQLRPQLSQRQGGSAILWPENRLVQRQAVALHEAPGVGATPGFRPGCNNHSLVF